jgi:hypothetical protein
MICTEGVPPAPRETDMSDTGDDRADDDLEVVEVESAGVDDEGNVFVDDLVVAVDKDGHVVASDETVAVLTEDGDMVMDETISVAGDDGKLHAIKEDITVLEAEDQP